MFLVGIFKWLFPQVTLLCQLVATKDSLNNNVIDSFFSANLFKNTDLFGNKTSSFLLTIFFTDQLNQWISDSHIKESDCFIPEWIRVWTNQLNHWFICEQNKILSLWVSHWSVHSADLFKSTDPFRNETSDSLWVSHWVSQRYKCICPTILFERHQSKLNKLK